MSSQVKVSDRSLEGLQGFILDLAIPLVNMLEWILGMQQSLLNRPWSSWVMPPLMFLLNVVARPLPALHPIHTTHYPGYRAAQFGIGYSVNWSNCAEMGSARHHNRWAGSGWSRFQFNVNALLMPNCVNFIISVAHRNNLYIFMHRIIMAVTWGRQEKLKLVEIWGEDSIQTQLEGCHRNKDVYMCIACKINESSF